MHSDCYRFVHLQGVSVVRHNLVSTVLQKYCNHESHNCCRTACLSSTDILGKCQSQIMEPLLSLEMYGWRTVSVRVYELDCSRGVVWAIPVWAVTDRGHYSVSGQEAVTSLPPGSPHPYTPRPTPTLTVTSTNWNVTGQRWHRHCGRPPLITLLHVKHFTTPVVKCQVILLVKQPVKLDNLLNEIYRL